MGTWRLESVCKVYAKVYANFFQKIRGNKVYLIKWGVLLLGACEGAHGRPRDSKPKSLSFTYVIRSFFLKKVYSTC